VRIDLIPPEAWTALCDRYREKLPYPEKSQVQVQIYSGYRHALLEITQSLSRLFTHKKTIAVSSKTEPSFESVAVGFSEEGCVVQTLETQTAAQVAPELAKQTKELLFTLVSEDDPITGRLYDFSPIDQALKDQRVFRIKLSHEAFRTRALEKPGLYEIQILSLRPDLALVIAGERCRIHPALAPRLPWTVPDDATIAKDLTPLASSKSEIEAFESQLPAGFRRYFDANAPRLMDRAVIWHPAFDGSAIIDELASTLGEKLARPGENSALETSSPCRWPSPRLTEWLLSRGEKEEVLRGMIVISADLVKRGLTPQLSQVAATLTKLQNG
jgi:hypothetical protein